jgi:hypothetical protein
MRPDPGFLASFSPLRPSATERSVAIESSRLGIGGTFALGIL